MSYIKQLFGQTAIYGLGTVVPRLLNYVLLTPFFTRIFRPGEYGIVTELYAYVVFLMVILTYGMETGFFKFAESTGNRDEVYGTSLLSLFTTSGIFIFIIMILTPCIAGEIGYNENKEYIKWLSVIVGADAFTAIPFAKLRLENKAVKFAVLKIINVIINIGCNFIFLWILPGIYENSGSPVVTLIYSPEMSVGYVFISNLIASLCTLILLLPEIFKVKIHFNRLIWKSMIIYSMPLLVSGLAGTVNEALDRILLKHLITGELDPMEQVGIYGANYKLAVLMTLFVQMFRFASEPFYFTKAKKENAKEMFADVMKYFVIAGLIIFMIVTMYMDIFKHFIGSQFHVGIRIVPVVLFANFLLGIFFNLSIWYKLTNLTKYGAIITTFGAIITFIINWTFIPVYGYIASAWAHLICYLSMVIISYILGEKYFKIRYDVRTILFYISVSLLLYIISAMVEYPSIKIKMMTNTGLICLFVAIVMVKEGMFKRIIKI